ncbi:mitochondrial chaperone BCS1 [Mycena floridula]|nr:mitochondrial chaperone BCS1 [Mycena floridula]
MDFSSQSTTGFLSSWIPQFMGLSSLFGAVFSSKSYLWDSMRLLAMGSVIETGRRLFQWFVDRFRFQYSITGQFNEGDPAYEWIILFLTQEKVWRRSRDFRVNAANSKRKWGIRPGAGGDWGSKDTDTVKDNADYVPTYEVPQLFRWKRKDFGQSSYWVEIKRTKGLYPSMIPGFGGRIQEAGTLFVTIYTLDMSALSSLVEEARRRYVEVSRPNVTIHIADQPSYGPGVVWTHVKHKTRRPLGSIILQQGVLQSLLEDAQDFIDTEEWYTEAGIPHRKGYLLFGPPGTGKSSTIYALAGELGLEIYSLSLASSFVDDSFLQRAVSSIPKHSILLIEDIDCVFASRDELDFMEEYGAPDMMMPGLPPNPFSQPKRSSVSLSGLLNVIDGVGSEEGRLFFATTNYIDRIDPALTRPGRIDKKIEYHHATKDQASALFKRFFRLDDIAKLDLEDFLETEKSFETGTLCMEDLAARFASLVPPSEFTTAELQGFLLSCKKNPAQALLGISVWVEEERKDRAAKKVRDQERRDKAEAAKSKRINAMRGMYAGGSPRQDTVALQSEAIGDVSTGLTPPLTPTVGSESLEVN